MASSSIIALADEAPFRIGPLQLIPAAYEIVHDDRGTETLEPRVMQVLVLLARVDGAVVTRHALNEACWQGRIVGDDAINRVISRLRRMAEGLGNGVFHIDTVSKIGYRLVRNPGIDTDPDGTVDGGKPSDIPDRHFIGRRLTFGAAVFLAIAATGMWWQSGAPVSGIAAQARPTPQLRMSPLARLSSDVSPALAFAAQEEIVTAFGQTSMVDIITGPAIGPPGALDWTLNGAIDRIGPNLRFTIHVTHESTGKVVWSSAFERPAEDSSRALKSIAAVIHEIVAPSLIAAASYRGGTLPDATAALMFQFNRDTTLPVGPYDHAEEELRRAVAQTPDFGAGWTALALSLSYTATASDEPLAMAAARAEAPAVIAKALRYSPGDALALMARAKVVTPSDFLGREAAFVAATSAPTSEMGAEHSAYAVFLLNVGRIRDAVREAKITYDLDPLASLFMSRYAKALGQNGQTVLAAAAIDQVLALWPGDVPSLNLRIRSAFWTAAYDDGIATVKLDPATPARLKTAIVEAFTALRNHDEARGDTAASRLVRLSLDPALQTPIIALALGALSHQTDAMTAANRLIVAKGAMAAEVLFDPTLATARRTPQFASLVQRIGLTSYWKRSGRPPDFCDQEGKSPVCDALHMPNVN